VLFVADLRSEVREESHKAGALDRHSDFSLAGSRDAGTLLAHDLSVRVRELAQVCHVLVVDELLVLDFLSF
jgi:hypothetical protein